MGEFGILCRRMPILGGVGSICGRTLLDELEEKRQRTAPTHKGPKRQRTALTHKGWLLVTTPALGGFDL